MQVPNVLDSLLKGETPSYDEPIQWTHATSEWRHDVQLYELLRARYLQDKSSENAQRWAAFVEHLRPCDWQAFSDFFTTCPKQYQTKQQREVTNRKRSSDAAVASMQLRHWFAHQLPTYDEWLKSPECFKHMDLSNVLPIVQHAWTHSSELLVSKYLPARLAEYFEVDFNDFKMEDIPNHGVGLLMSAMLLGMDSTPAFLLEDTRYYHACCTNASNEDLLKLLLVLRKNIDWQDNMLDTFEMHWFEPFLQNNNPHRSLFSVFQSMEPTVDIDQLIYCLKQQKQSPAESYSLESMDLS